MSHECDKSSDIETFYNNSDMRLCGENRWVRLTEVIPWRELQKQYGAEWRDAFRSLFAACLIQAHYGFNDEQTIMQIQESPYLQYFCGMKGYNGTKLPIEAEALPRFRSCLGEAELDGVRRIIERSCG